MRIDILTLFPDFFTGILEESIIKRAIDKGIVEINLIDFRDFSTNKHHKVDDYAFSGGKGMLLQIEPIDLALKSITNYQNAKKVLLTPQGKTYNQEMAYDYAKEDHLILIAGHYEGFDERVVEYLIDDEVSVGDYVLTGGEIPAMLILDSVVRLVNGAIQEESHLTDSFNNNILEYPQYTRPRSYLGMEVPEILFSGHDANIKKWKEYQAIKKTYLRRKDLVERFDDEQKKVLKEVIKDLEE